MQLHFPPDAQSQSAFDAQAYLARLATQTLGSTILTTAELPSTQTLLHDNASMIPDGTVCVADRQVTGKGDLAHANNADPHAVATLSSVVLAVLPNWEVLPHCFTVIIAACAGRGHNTWHSPPGCLMFSLLTHIKLPGQWLIYVRSQCHRSLVVCFASSHTASFRMHTAGVRLPFVQYVASLAIVQAIQGQAKDRLQVFTSFLLGNHI